MKELEKINKFMKEKKIESIRRTKFGIYETIHITLDK